ncbi:MAG: isoprenylcysteine carboxylmethyltransferase family protein [Myxococcota bacterium]|nr:isoprenylcysteine carboxylmethyltransferase family protein [Myxococcota bacterium]MEE2780503.1 isoprenylcysteine carboxylmethyltransferase family protein [Myxococcota bacterium]
MSAKEPGIVSRALFGAISVSAAVAVMAFFQPSVIWTPQVWCIFVTGVLANALQPAYKPFEGSRTPEDKGTAAQILWSIQICQVAAFLEAVLLRWPESFQWDAVASVAVFLMAVGLWIRTWAIRTLGRFFTWNVTVQEGQRVIREGPYRWVRHPSYTGAFLTYFSTILLFHSWWSLGLASVLMPWAFLRRIRHEEALLERSLEGYDVFKREVKALIPWVL